MYYRCNKIFFMHVWNIQNGSQLFFFFNIVIFCTCSFKMSKIFSVVLRNVRRLLNIIFRSLRTCISYNNIQVITTHKYYYYTFKCVLYGKISRFMKNKTIIINISNGTTENMMTTLAR